jgi:outer membrane biosynthesis protein TonB
VRPSFGASRVWLPVIVCIAAGAAAAAGYGLTAPKRYRATAQLLVAPVSPGDPTFAGLGVLRDTGGKQTAAADVAALLRAPQIADAVAAQLALKRSRTSLQHALHAHVIDSSDVVAVTADDTSAAGAAQLANTFANALITQRSATFQSELSAAIRRDQRLLAGFPPAQRSTGDGGAIARRLTTLRGFAGQQDPTVRVASQAAMPTHAFWPSLPTLVGIGAGIGAVVGVLVALMALAVRRGRRAAGGQYDRSVSDPVSDRALDRLVDRLESKLAARESALAARERDLQAALEELRAAKETPATQAVANTADDSELTRREEKLGERIARVTAREVELARRAAALAMREREFDARPEPEPEPVPEQEPEPMPEPEPEQAPEPPPAAAAAVQTNRNGHYNLVTLEGLVEHHSGEFPDRAEEWTSYLFFLRDYAAPDGSLPDSFDALISDTFADVL